MNKLTKPYTLKIFAMIVANLSMLAGLSGTIISILRPELLFSETMQMYGPIKNNLVFIWLYIGITEVALFILQFYKQIINESLIFGLIMILVAFGTIFYSQINQLPFSIPMFVLCLTIATGHLIYYFIVEAQTNHQTKNHHPSNNH